MQGNLANVLNGPFTLPDPDPPEVQLYHAMTQAGLEAPEHLVLDGSIHRFSTGGSKDAGWYVAYGDNVPSGCFGSWQTGESVTWTADIGRELSTAEEMARSRKLAELRQKRDEARKARQETTANTVSMIWASAGLASDDHPYLKRKHVKSHGLRITGDGRLMAPLYDQDRTLSSLQYISSDGSKQYHAGGAVKARFMLLGSLEASNTLYIAEGYATAASIHEATGKPTAAAFSAGNIPKVTESFRTKYQTLSITIVADNDESGTGQSYAEQASAKYGATVIVPPHGDANDFVQAGGDLLGLLEPPAHEPWLVSADEYSREPTPLTWIVKHWLQDHSLSMVHGPSGSGKSFIVLDWCMRIASSLESSPESVKTWNGNKVSSGTVVYLAGEGHHGIHSRIAAWKQHNHITKLDMYISSSGTDLDKPEGLHKTLTAIKQSSLQPKLIVVDTLHRFLSGNENDSVDTRNMLNSCSLLMSEFDCSVMLVHHTGVNPEAQKRGRGSSAWRGALDNEMSVKQENGKIRLSSVKMKDSEEPDAVWLDMVSVPIKGWVDEDGEQVGSIILEPTSAPEKRKSNKQLEDIDQIKRAWFASGAEDMDGIPYLSRSAWKEFMVSNLGTKPSSATQAVKMSGNGIAGRLAKEGIVQDFKNGVLVIEPNLLQAMILERKGTKCTK